MVLAAGVALALGAIATDGRAEGSPPEAGVHLSWIRSATASSCPDAGHVQADVVQRLGRNPFTEPSQTFVEGSVSKEGTRWQAEIEMRDAGGNSLGTREVTSEAPLCASLGSAAGLAIALMIDPDAQMPKAVSIKPAVAPPPQRVSQDKPAPLPPSAIPRGALSGALVAALRILPQAALGLRLGGELRLFDRVDTALSVTFLPEQRLLREGHDVSFGLTAAGLGPCYRVFDGSIVRLSACASLLVGALHAVVFDPARGRTSQLLWLAATAGLRADWSPILRWKLHVGVDGVAPLQHRDYLVEQAPAEYGTVFTDPWVSGIFYLGMGVQY